jgi:hypothetical protein
MTMIEAHLTAPTKRAKSSTSGKSDRSKAAAKRSSAQSVPKTAAPRDEPRTARSTKHDCILVLLNRREGATIPEIMEASGWQQHSVRGFLAGTVKKKLGLTLNSSKTAGEPRRYRIESKRGR